MPYCLAGYCDRSHPKVKDNYSVCGAVGICNFMPRVILIKAYVILVFGMVPNSLSSILVNLNVDRPQTLPFDKTGVNEIGRKWSFMSVIGFFLGSGYNVSILPGLRT